MTDYRYRYDASGSPTPDVPNIGHGAAKPYLDPWRYDDETRAVIARNVSRSLELDAQRATQAPTTSQLRAQALAEVALT